MKPLAIRKRGNTTTHRSESLVPSLARFTGLLAVVAVILARTQTASFGQTEWEFVGPQVLKGNDAVCGGAYGAGRWVATSLGWSTTLTNGGNHWTYPQGQGEYSSGYSRMAFLGDKFLWWGANNYTGDPLMAASDDGLSWKLASAVPGDPDPDPFRAVAGSAVESVAYGEGVYVAVGFHGYPTPSGTIWWSTNAYEWRQVYQLPGENTNLWSVAFGDGNFIAVGDFGTAVSSADGLNWAPLDLGDTTLTNRMLQGIGYGPPGWIITMDLTPHDPRDIATSLDGTNWSVQAPTFYPNPRSYYSFYADGKYWFTSKDDSYITTDGISWTNLGKTSVRRAPDGVKPKFLGGTQTDGVIYGSEDATNWNMLAAEGTSWPNVQTVIAASGEWLASGIGCYGNAQGSGDSGFRPLEDTSTTNLWVPSLGWPVSWHAGADLSWVTDSIGFVGDYIAYHDQVFTAGCSLSQEVVTLKAGPIILSNHSSQSNPLAMNGRDVPNETYKGTPAFWSYCNAALAQTPQGLDLYEEASVFYADGTLPVSRWGHYSSPDGTNWVLRTAGLNDVTKFPGIRGIAWGAGQYVAVATGSSPGISPSTNRIYTSTDGESYTPVDLSGLSPGLGNEVGLTSVTNQEGLTSVMFAGGAFVAVGDQGTILYSADGLSWANVRAADYFGWKRVRYLNNQFWVVGQAGRVASSPDGLAWTTQSTGVANDLNDIASANGHYIIVGNNAMVLQSTFSAGSGPTNQPPVASSIPDQSGTYGTPFSYAFPTNTFTDPDAGATLSYVASGMPPGISFNGATLTFSGVPTAVGSYQVRVTATDSGTPPLSASTTFNFTVSSVPLNIAADNKTNVYGAPLPTFTVTPTGLVNGDTLGVLLYGLAFTTAATSSSPVGAYSIVPSGLSSPNYAITFTPGTLYVTPAPLTITPDNQTNVYGAALPALTVSYSGFTNGDTAGVLTTLPTLTTTATASSGVGAYPITATGAVASNYTISYVPGTLTVSPAALTVTANNQTRVYGAALPTLTLSYAGFVNGDTLASLTAQPSITTAATVSSSVGTYPITASGAVDPNYTFNYVPGTLTVTPAMLKITAITAYKFYGVALPPVLPVHYSGFVNGDSAASLTTLPTVSSTATVSSAVGSYPITVSGAVDPNYTINYVAGTLTVAPAALTITVNNATKVYGAALPIFNVNYSGFVNGDTSANVTTQPTVSTKVTASSSVGSYPISASGAVAPNYTITYVAGTLTVTPATLTVTADNQQKVYGQPNPTLTYTISGFVNGDTAKVVKGSPMLSTPATTLSPVGEYPITVTQGTLSANNYGFVVFVPGNILVNNASTTTTPANVIVQTGAASATLTTTVASISPSTATVNEGTVTFRVFPQPVGTLIATVTSGRVANGSVSATLNTSSLPIGLYTIEALYGDNGGNFYNSVGVSTLNRR